MASKTKAQLAIDVLRELGVIDALHSPSAEDAAFVEGAYDDRHASLQDKGLAYWPNTGRTVAEIPQAIFGALVAIVADDVAVHYGVKREAQQDEYGRVLMPGIAGLRELRAHIAKRPSGESTRAVYY